MTGIDTQSKLDIILRKLGEKKAENVEVVDLRERTLIADHFVICNGTSSTHIKAISDGLVIEAKQEDGLQKNSVEGYAEARWVLIDYGDIVVHVFAPEEREYYDIESLWQQTAVKLESAAQ